MSHNSTLPIIPPMRLELSEEPVSPLRKSKTRTACQADIGSGQSPAHRRRRCHSFPNKQNAPTSSLAQSTSMTDNSTTIEAEPEIENDSSRSVSPYSSGMDSQFISSASSSEPDINIEQTSGNFLALDNQAKEWVMDTPSFNTPRGPPVRKVKIAKPKPKPELFASAPAVLNTAALVCPPSPKKHTIYHSRSHSSSESCLGATRFDKTFKVIKLLGKSRLSEVYECIHLATNAHYAVKKIALKYKDYIAREKNAMLAIKDLTHLIRFYDFWEEDGYAYIQMELCKGGSLEKRLGNRFEELELYQILFQIGLGLQHLHSLKLAHLDIKPANMFIRNLPNGKEEFILADFNTTVDWTTVTKQIETEGDGRYLAKELLSWNKPDMIEQCDVFSLGASIYELALGRQLASGEEIKEIQNGILQNLPHYTPQFNELLKRMVNPVPANRITVDMLLEQVTTERPDLLQAHFPNYLLSKWNGMIELNSLSLGLQHKAVVS